MSSTDLENGFAGMIKCTVEFILSNNDTFSLSTGIQDTAQNYIQSIKVEEKLSTNTNMPVGVNNGNVLNIEIVSENNALIPDNKNSIYYGYMNNKAIIKLTVYDEENEKTTSFGKYYVKTWKSERDNENPNLVQIEAVNIMSLLAQSEVPDTIINSGMYIKDWLINAVTKINDEMSDNKKINIVEKNINFDEFPQMQFCNISTDNMGDAMNQISQCTLTNIFTDRSNNIKTDYACDINVKDAKYRLDILNSAECSDSFFIDYDGVKVTYSKGDINKVELLGSVDNKDITSSGLSGDDAIQIDLGDGVYKINRIECITSNDNILVYPSKATYSKHVINIELKSTGSTTVRIEVYGQRLNTTELNYSIKGTNKLKVTNKIIKGKSYIKKYATELCKLIKIKTDQIRISGYFRTDIELSDTIYVDLTGAMDMSGYYKVIAMEWDLGMYGFCNMTLIKTA